MLGIDDIKSVIRFNLLQLFSHLKRTHSEIWLRKQEPGNFSVEALMAQDREVWIKAKIHFRIQIGLQIRRRD